MSMKTAIETKLAAALAPQKLNVINESHLHAGHMHHPGEDHHNDIERDGETHFRVQVVSARFDGLNRVARHRLINELLAAELAGGVHALAIEASAPGEPTRRG